MVQVRNIGMSHQFNNIIHVSASTFFAKISLKEGSQNSELEHWLGTDKRA